MPGGWEYKMKFKFVIENKKCICIKKEIIACHIRVMVSTVLYS